MKRRVAGHAFFYCLSGRWPVYVTIVARGGHGGYMERAANDLENPLRTKKEIIDDLRVSLGGRAAEVLYYDEDGLSTGAAGDLQNATSTAKRMICQYGMDEKIGLLSISPEEASRGPMANKINEAISTLLRQELEQTMEIIRNNEEKLSAITKTLMEKNRLTAEELKQIIGGN